MVMVVIVGFFALAGEMLGEVGDAWQRNWREDKSLERGSLAPFWSLASIRGYRMRSVHSSLQKLHADTEELKVALAASMVA